MVPKPQIARQQKKLVFSKFFEDEEDADADHENDVEEGSHNPASPVARGGTAAGNAGSASGR